MHPLSAHKTIMLLRMVDLHFSMIKKLSFILESIPVDKLDHTESVYSFHPNQPGWMSLKLPPGSHQRLWNPTLKHHQSYSGWKPSLETWCVFCLNSIKYLIKSWASLESSYFETNVICGYSTKKCIWNATSKTCIWNATSKTEWIDLP